MSSTAHHWEARFRQHQVDKTFAATRRLAEKEAAEEKAKCELAARQAHKKRQDEESRKAVVQKQIQTRDTSTLKKSYREREKQLHQLLQEQRWHNEMIQQMEREEQEHLKADALRDHNNKSKVLRDHGIYRGDSSFFQDPEYA